MLNRFLLFVFFFTLPIVPASAQAERDGEAAFVKLGEISVLPGAKSSRIDLSAVNGRSSAVRLRMAQGRVTVSRISIEYSNGQVFTDDSERRLDPKDRTKLIDERPEGRFIDAVEVSFPDTRLPSAPAVLEIWARQTPSDAAAVRGTVLPPPDPEEERTRGTPRSPVPAAEKPFVAVPVYYGTDRKRGADILKNGRKLAVYTNEGSPTFALGMAVVTVPTRKDRDPGAITRPEWNLFFTSIAFRDEDMALDFTVQSVEELSESAFVEKARERLQSAKDFKDQTFVFVHGYNVVFDDALFRTAQIAHDTGFDGGAFLYSWPSSGKLVGYTHDLKRVDGARDHLIHFLNIVRSKTGATKVHLIAHSMGAELLTGVLRDIALSTPEAERAALFEEIILASPDVTRDNFLKRYKMITPLGRGITLYASQKDRALRVSGSVALGELPIGHIPRAGGPLVLTGIDTIDASGVSSDFLSLNHSDFAERAPLLQDIASILKTGVRPPKLRYAPFEEITGRAGTYWKYPRPN
ncbi:alpha/beta hydrolase [Hyphomicrobium sp.]|uniref:alpha/beta hydrolase n=1 Tax=Hyphomicrobium sp. TaxID=82 RepID=UPI0025C0DE58|nr:alpha/beta hydrolase [Hyphomicrobium sp.]MCC7254006.1 alpha/beta hydrolase [Hyphomicrobium sp.]